MKRITLVKTFLASSIILTLLIGMTGCADDHDHHDGWNHPDDHHDDPQVNHDDHPDGPDNH
jgi:hypothetical protein